MKIHAVRALRFWAIVCAFSIAGITGSSGGQNGYAGSAFPLDLGKATETPPPVLVATNVTTGLENPRGIKFGPDGRLYVAEGGLGGSTSTIGRCKQVPAPIGPYLGGYTGRISAVDVTTGARTTIARNLASNQTSVAGGAFASSVADVAFLHRSLYALISGAGCSHGLAGTFNTIARISNGVATPIVDLSRYQRTHPVVHPEPDDFEPDGSWYSLVASGDAFYAVEPNHGEVDIVKPDGSIKRLVDVSASQGHIVPTAITPYGGQFLLGNLNTFAPGSQGNAKIFLLTKWGQLFQLASGLTAVTGVAVHHGRIYALESFTGFFAPAPPVAESGTVVRLGRDYAWHTVVGGLSFPTAMTFGDDNTLYIANKGFGQAKNTAGTIVKVRVRD